MTTLEVVRRCGAALRHRLKVPCRLLARPCHRTISRVSEGKHDACIYDYADTRVPVLARMYAKRERVYRSLGYEFGAVPEASYDEDLEASNTFMWPEPG